MVKMKSIRHLPYLDIYISMPYFSVRTELLNRQIESMCINYICLRIKLYKWEWYINLYSPYRDLVR
jgi:hypothetical protein